jgi:hypothetical protein
MNGTLATWAQVTNGTMASWANVMNGTMFRTNQWNATNTSYMLITQWNATNTSYLTAETLWNANYTNLQPNCGASAFAIGVFPNGTLECSAASSAESDPKAYNGTLVDVLRLNNGTYITTLVLNNGTYTNTTNTSYLAKSGDTMTGNLNLSANVNLTMNGGNQIGSNVTCVTIKGSTSILEIC